MMPLLWLLITMQTTNGQAPDVVESQAVVLVEVPIEVVRRGEPVRDLSAANFEILDNGVPQQILSFDIYDMHASVSEATPDAPMQGPVPADSQRHFVVLFDLYFNRLQGIQEAAESARAMVHDQLTENDRVSVAVFHPNLGLRLLTMFTPDRQRVLAAINTIERVVTPGGTKAKKADQADQPKQKSDPLGMTGRGFFGPDGKLGIPLSQSANVAREALVDHSDGDREAALIKRNLAKLAFMENLGAPDAATAAIFDFGYELAYFSYTFRQMRGRKFIVYLTEGFPNNLLYRSPYANMVQAHLNQMVEICQISGWAYHTIDTRGLRPGGANVAQDSLFMLAEDTGGNFYRNYNNLDRAMTRVEASTSLVYKITFQPKALIQDGTYHRIAVKLKDVPSGTQVQYHKPGYFAPLPEIDYDERQPMSGVNKAELLAGSDVGGPLEAEVTAMPFNRTGNMARVPVAIRLPSSLAPEPDDPSLALELYIYAFESGGTIPDFVTRDLILQPDERWHSEAEAGFHYLGELVLPPGNYRVRTLIYNRRDARFHVSGSQFVVPNFEGTTPGFYTALGMRASEGLILKDDQATATFMTRGRSFLPVRQPSLAAGEKTMILLSGYDVPRVRLDFDHRIFDPFGRSVEGGDLRVRGRSAEHDDGFFRVQAQLDTAGLAAGNYLLEIYVRARGAERPYRTTLKFSVVGE